MTKSNLIIDLPVLYLFFVLPFYFLGLLPKCYRHFEETRKYGPECSQLQGRRESFAKQVRKRLYFYAPALNELKWFCDILCP